MELCASSLSLMDVAIFVGQCGAATVAVFAGAPIGALVARLVSLERLEVMAKKPKDSWLGIILGTFLFLLAMLAAGGIGVATAIGLKHFGYESVNLNTTIGMCVFGLLMGVSLGTDIKVRERVELVKTDHRALLKYL